MRYLITTFLLFISTSILYGQFTPVNLGNWKHEGLPANGSWTISTDSTSVRQGVNDEPTFFVSPDTFENVTIRGSFFVDGGDDDYIGFVFGYLRPDSAEEYFDFYLLDWKGATQSGAQEGFTLSKVLGYVNVGSGTNTSHPYWDHMDTTQTIIGTYYGDYGWTRNIVYDFELIHEPNRVRITIDTTLIFDISGDFRPGRFGFYNYSQPGVNYREFRLNEAPVAVDDYFNVWEDSSLAMHVTLNDIDADGNDMIIIRVGESINGIINYSQGDSLIYYTPDADFFGTDSFYYHISDGTNSADSAKVVININSVNDPPVRVTKIPDTSIKENSSGIFYAAINDYFSDVDENDAFLEDISVTSNGDVTAYTSLDSLFLSSQNFVGFDTLIVSVADDSGIVATDTVVIEVINTNTPPYVKKAIPDTVLNNDSQNIFYRKLNNVFADLDANDVPLDSFYISTGGIVIVDLKGDSLYLSANNIAGLDTITVTAVDDSNAVFSDTFVVEVLDVTGLEDLTTPEKFSLHQNYPNPFNPSTTIKFTIPKSETVNLQIYNTLGQMVRNLVEDKLQAGSHEFEFNANHLPSGVYFYKVQAGNYVDVKKMILLK